MTKVYCCNDDCIHCDADNKTCCLSMIVIGDGIEYGCEDYKCYLDTKEYSEEFYALVGKRGKPIGREKRHGKKIEYNGRVFYAQSKVSHDKYFSVTDAKTGLAVNYNYVLDNWNKFIECADKQADIESFPVVVNCDDGEYHVVEEGKDDGSERKAD